MRLHLIAFLIFLLITSTIWYFLTSPEIITWILGIAILFFTILGMIELYKFIYRSVKNIFENE